ncbi:hypothetical protein GYB61_07115 [bacterium]|nr:hypothetical protein [bacterium]
MKANPISKLTADSTPWSMTEIIAPPSKRRLLLGWLVIAGSDPQNCGQSLECPGLQAWLGKIDRWIAPWCTQLPQHADMGQSKSRLLHIGLDAGRSHDMPTLKALMQRGTEYRVVNPCALQARQAQPC